MERCKYGASHPHGVVRLACSARFAKRLRSALYSSACSGESSERVGVWITGAPA
jgi:hypothetical protein